MYRALMSILRDWPFVPGKSFVRNCLSSIANMQRQLPNMYFNSSTISVELGKVIQVVTRIFIGIAA